ncbi:MAG: NBR1-Ig-like domain-containing protein [Anaerolineaceae bacterium]
MNKKTISSVLFSAVIISTLLLSACAASTPTISPDQIMTNVAQTVEVDFTRTAIARPTDTPTPLPTPTNTPLPPTATFPPTNTPGAGATATTAPGGRDAGVWVSSNPADNSNIPAGLPFNVALTLMNTGTTTWTTAYAIKFVSGDRLGASETMNMPYEVPPTKTVTFTMNFTAPSSAGSVRGDWSIVNAAGTSFSTFYFEYNIVTP